MKKENQKIHNSNFIEACNNAINGIIYATTTQSNVKKQLILAVVLLFISLFFNLSKAEFLALVFAMFLIIFAEMINTAIETIVDLYTDIYHPKAKIAKDVGAGAVVLAAFNGVVVAYFLFFDKIGIAGTSILQQVINSPEHLTFVAIMFVIIAIVALKATNIQRKNKMKNQSFVPSGQSAVAFAALTAIWINTDNIIIFTLSLILSILVVENRIETKMRSVSEVIFGGAIGVLIVLLIYTLTIIR